MPVRIIFGVELHSARSKTGFLYSARRLTLSSEHSSLNILCRMFHFFQEVDPKAGGGCTMTIGQMVRSFLLKLEWYGTLFPRIPVPVQKDLEAKLRSKGLCDDHKRTAQEGWGEAEDFVKRTRDER